MNLKQKKIKLKSLNKLIPKLHSYPETQDDAVDEYTVLNDEIQRECKHKFTYHGDIGLCECGVSRMT